MPAALRLAPLVLHRSVARFRLLAVGLLLSAAGCAPFSPWAAPAREGREVAFRIDYAFTSPGRTPWVKMVALVPKSIPGRQIVHDVQFSPPPLRLYEADDRRYAEFLFTGIVSPFTVTVRGTARLLRDDLETARRLSRAIATPDLRLALLDEPSLERDDPAIAQAAASIQGADELDTLRKLYDLVLRRMEFGGNDLGPGGGAAKALQSAKGDCTDYADLLVALCRAKGLPARHVLGLLALPDNDVPQHSWVEVWLPRLGWVPFDPILDDVPHKATFDRLGPYYLAFSSVRNDPLLEHYHAFAVYRWWGDKVTLEETYEILPISGQ